MPDKSGNHGSRFEIVIIAFLANIQSLVHESKLANASLSSGWRSLYTLNYL